MPHHQRISGSAYSFAGSFACAKLIQPFNPCAPRCFDQACRQRRALASERFIRITGRQLGKAAGFQSQTIRDFPKSWLSIVINVSNARLHALPRRHCR